MILDRRNVSHGAIPVGKVMSLSTSFVTTSYNNTPPGPGLEWGTLAAGVDGYILTCSAAAAEGLAWAAVTNFSTAIADGTVLANATGSSAVPTATTLTALIDDALGGIQGNILYRDASAWKVLAPGVKGQALQSGGTGANPTWSGTTITIGSNHMTWAAAAPSTGTWAVGDVCWNTGTTAGGSPGWVNTSATGSGVWKAMPVIAS